MNRRTVLVLAGLLLVQSVILALAYTPAPHSGGDNAGYISLAHSLLDRGAYLELWDPGEAPHTKYPPVFPIVLAMAILLGAKSWAALKLVPAFSTVLAVAFTFLWARERRGMALGVVVALLLGLSDTAVYYSRWVLSDPTFLALTMAALWALQISRGSREDSRTAESRGEGDRWLWVGMALVILAYFTRSAGLPLAAATLLWLGLQRRWKALAGFALAFGVPAALWWLRGRVLGGSAYVSEFWMVNPYQPELGTVGPWGLVVRVKENLVAYVTFFLPSGVVGQGRSFLLPLGVGLGLVTLLGWVRALRERASAAEFFFPLYFGLILLWPPAWSGDRFALPLLPLMFFYAGTAVLWLTDSLPVRVRQGAAALLVLALAFPAARQWQRTSAGAELCRELTRLGFPRECLSEARREYFAVAEWSGENLPDGAVVTTRKPRIFFLMSGVKAVSIPLVTDPDEFLARVREGGSRFILLDILDTISEFYVFPVLLDRFPDFCGMVEVGVPGEAGTQLLGLVEGVQGVDPDQEDSGYLPGCPEDMVRTDPLEGGLAKGWGIPLLLRERKAGR